jgi:hypothetical protein
MALTTICYYDVLACSMFPIIILSTHSLSVDASAFLAQAWTKCETFVRISRVFIFHENCIAIVFVSGGFCIIKLVAFDLHKVDFQIPLDEPPQRHVSHVFWELGDNLWCGGMMQPFYFRFRWHQLFIVFSAEVYAYRTNFMSFVSFSNIFLCVICLSPWASSLYTDTHSGSSVMLRIVTAYSFATLRLHDDRKERS